MQKMQEKIPEMQFDTFNLLSIVSNRTNARCFVNSKFTSVISTSSRRNMDMFSKQLQATENNCCENSSSIRKSQLFERDTRIQK